MRKVHFITVAINVFGIVFFNPAVAAGCTTISGTEDYICNGVETTHQQLTGDYLNVTLGDSSWLIGGLSLISGSSLTLNQHADGIISGTPYGIYAQNDGNDGSILNTSGAVMGGDWGIYASSISPEGKGLIINQLSGKIIGSYFGINTYNVGSGDTSIATSGNVYATDDDYGIGIFSQNTGTESKKIIITQVDGSIKGGLHGIQSRNEGSGETNITTSGNVSGVSGDGIYVYHYSDATITQFTGKISGGSSGIFIENYGFPGVTTLNISGEVKGGSISGITTSSVENSRIFINLNDGSDVYADSDIAIMDGDGDAFVSLNIGSKVSGKILLGDGSDTLTVNRGSDITNVTVLDGGTNTTNNSTDVLNINESLAGSSESHGSAGDISIINWDIINVGNNSGQDYQASLMLTGDLDTGEVNVASGSVIKFSSSLNTASITGNVSNTGTLDLSGGLSAGNTLTINGNYTGVNGNLVLNTVLNDDNSATDRLIVNGSTSGHTWVAVNNLGGTGASTVEGIEIVTVNGSSEGTFDKSERIVAGAYDYNVVQKGSNWYLTSLLSPTDPTDPEKPVIPSEHQYRPESGSYLANIMAANTLFATRLHDRLGETQYTDVFTGEKKVTSLWMRHIGGHNRFKDASGQLSTQSNRYVMQLGGDIAQWSTDGLDRWHLGLMAGYASSRSRTHSGLTGYSSRGEVSGYSAGVYGTWYANEQDKTGAYVDTWLLYNWFDNKVSGQGLASEKYDSDGITASVETGYTFRLDESSTGRDSYWLQPKAQLTWMDVQADRHTEKNGTRVVDNTDGNLQTRLGVRAFIQGNHAMDDGKDRTFQPFVEASWIYNSSNYSVKMDDLSNEVKGARNVGEVKVGVEGKVSNRLQLWGNVAQQVGDNGYSDTKGMLGMKYTF
ncbi:autotransporter outer membrane beta-barrel domain-containing protein [Citrobacter amalonaticus]|uniref:autotransporter outer membrane beta-barrel domain-containing protein n=1 Tax=Citrobacter amalonaticus TaxID=35703 RepID=UPI00215BF744|nr:autotransporter outer membrane beta-barrel domain-containing protein [Citrobacter amalonaticus]MCR9027395.1 autotransporter outer membrane beta-barrel domain-containing protein [Citrobacter amalonaticus]